MWRSSGVLYLPYIFRTLKRVYKPTNVISTKLLKMSSFLSKHGVWLQRESGVDLSDIYVWRMGYLLSFLFTLSCELLQQISLQSEQGPHVAGAKGNTTNCSLIRVCHSEWHTRS